MASLQKGGSHMCGGTLVAVDSVLSNAACFSSSPDASQWTVKLGLLNLNGSNPFEVTLNVTNITLSNLTGSNVAVLQLTPQPTLSDYIQPICIDNGLTFAVGTTCWAAGWSSEQGGDEQVLQEIQTSIQNCGNASSDTICTETFTVEQVSSKSSTLLYFHMSFCFSKVFVGPETLETLKEKYVHFQNSDVIPKNISKHEQLSPKYKKEC
ncbi:serine protease 27-like [Plectropomus leopardus]|uniref:serine protease 27-like n=1 Tax=Plectropomus leopardus TaxID=160734 RepID=UPI001C4B471C|nr:serine protease 27-like [Plectropomus leopardus]